MISEIRALTGLSHKNLAAWLGVSPSMVKFAEAGKRSLNSNGSKKLQLLAESMQQVNKAAAKKQPGTVSYTDPAAFAKQHREKAEYHRYHGGRLQWQLKKLTQQHTQLTNGQALINTMKNTDTNLYSRTERDKQITGLLEFFNRDKLERVTKKMELLQDKLELHLAYAEVHEKQMQRFELMKKKGDRKKPST